MTDPTDKKITIPAMKTGIAFIFAIVGIAGSVRLMASNSSPTSLVWLVSLCFFGLLLIFFGDQVDWFDLKNLKVKMRRIEQVRSEVENREERIRKMALMIGEMAAFSAVFSGMMGGSHTVEIKWKWALARIKKLEALTGDKISGANVDWLKKSAAGDLRPHDPRTPDPDFAEFLEKLERETLN